MTPLLPLDDCLKWVLPHAAPVAPREVPVAQALGGVLAAALALDRDMPARAQALRAGLAVSAFDTVGASPQLPQPLPGALRVQPGDALPEAANAVLPEESLAWTGTLPQAIRAIGPGEGIRRAGHDGRAGQTIAPAGARLGPWVALLAAEAGIDTVMVRQPRVQVMLDSPAHGAFAARWAAGFGAILSDTAPQLRLRSCRDHVPRLALTGAETAWLDWQEDVLVVELPPRFDAMITGLLALALPVLLSLTGAAAAPAATRPLLRKLASAPGMSDLVLLSARPEGWLPSAPGLVTLAALAQARAFAILPPGSEGLPAGSALAGHALAPEPCEVP